MTAEIDVELRACIDFLQNYTNQQLDSPIEQLLAQQDKQQVASLLVEALVVAFNQPPQDKHFDRNYEESLEGCAQVILNFIYSNQVDAFHLVTHLAQQLRQSEPFGPLRLRTVARIYNSIPETETVQRQEFFILTVQVASKVSIDGMEFFYIDEILCIGPHAGSTHPNVSQGRVVS